MVPGHSSFFCANHTWAVRIILGHTLFVVPSCTKILLKYGCSSAKLCDTMYIKRYSCQANEISCIINPNQKTMSLWQHQGRLMYGTPNIFRPAIAGTNSLPLSWHVLAGVRPLIAPRERPASNLQTCKSLRNSTLFVGSFHEMYNCMKLHTGSAVARVTKDLAARPHLPSTVENQLRRRRQRRQLLTIGQWNVRTLVDREGANRLVAMELAKYNIDIAALCETRFSESGSLDDLEYSFFCSGKP